MKNIKKIFTLMLIATFLSANFVGCTSQRYSQTTPQKKEGRAGEAAKNSAKVGIGAALATFGTWLIVDGIGGLFGGGNQNGYPPNNGGYGQQSYPGQYQHQKTQNR